MIEINKNVFCLYLTFKGRPPDNPENQASGDVQCGEDSENEVSFG